MFLRKAVQEICSKCQNTFPKSTSAGLLLILSELLALGITKSNDVEI